MTSTVIQLNSCPSGQPRAEGICNHIEPDFSRLKSLTVYRARQDNGPAEDTFEAIRCQIIAAVEERARNSISDLEVIVFEDGVVVLGVTMNYYVRQLVDNAVMRLLAVIGPDLIYSSRISVNSGVHGRRDGPHK